MAPDTLVSFHIENGQKKAGFDKIIGEYADPDTKSQKITHCLKPMGFLLRRPRNLLSPQALIRAVPAL